MKDLRILIPCFLAVNCLGIAAALAAGDCSDYTDLTGLELPLVVTGTTAGATGDYGPFAEEPGCWEGIWDAGCAASGDVTYKWTAPQDGRFTFTLVGSSSFTDLQLYDFTCPAEPLYPDDYLCGAHRCHQSCAALWDVELLAGQEILIVVDGWFTWSGEFILHIYDTTTLDDSVAMAMDLNHYPAVSAACAWSETGRWQGNHGMADIDGGIPLDDDHVFSVYWITPMVTGAALMQLWEDGLFDLDDDVGDYLTFDVHHPAYPEIPITFRMLMSHVSGIVDNWIMLNQTLVYGGDPTVKPCELMEGYVTPGGDYYDAAANFLTAAPGTEWRYSHAGITLLGCLVEHINPEGLSFEDYCRAHIFDPLQMPASAFLPSSVDPTDRVTHYVWNDPVYQAQVPFSRATYPADGLLSNARDLSRFMLAFMQGGELYGQRILDAATVDSMLTAQFPGLSPTYDQGLTCIGVQYYGSWVWGMGGVNDRSQTGLWISRDEGTGAVALTNCRGSSGYAGPTDILDAEFRRAREWAAAMVGVPDGLTTPPALVQLGPCYPNPFNPRTNIWFGLPNNSHARLTIYDLRGHLVATLVDEPVTAGRHSVTWDGRNADGREVPSGVYFSRLEAGGQVAHGRMTLVR